MTLPTPRERAQAAFRIIDAHLPSNPRTAVAMAQLAAAMDDEFGPLPEESVLERIGRLRRAEANEGPRA